MADAHDPEKATPKGADAAAAPGTDSSSSATFTETGSAGGRRRGRPGSSGSDDTDPLEALDRALSSGQATDAERAAARGPVARTGTGAASMASAGSPAPDFEVTFAPDDHENPQNWALGYRVWVVFCLSFATWTVALYSTSYTASIPGLMRAFRAGETVVTLGVTTYLLGLAAGSLIVAPMGELFGRRPVYLLGMGVSILLFLPCALATSLSEIIVVRLFGAFFAAALLSNGPGTMVDIADEEHRALYMSLWSLAPLNGPVTGPVIGGFIYQYLGWRWDTWIVMIVSGAAAVLMLTVKETYAPAILRSKAARMRKETGDDRYWCRFDQKLSTRELLKVNLSRPFILSFTEPILWFFDIWIGIIYGILYLCFVAYPIVFEQHRGWGPGITGLSFLGIGIGTTLVIACEPLCRRLINSHAKDPETGRVAPEAMASVMIIGAILTPIGQLVFSWTCLPTSIHWAVPIAFGIPFGAGNTLAFIYGQSYLAGAYGYYAASALAGNAVVRAILGGTLPLAGAAMYKSLTPQWAGTLLGLLEVCLVPVPVIFYRYGGQIRSKSRIIRQMQEETATNQRRTAKNEARKLRKQEKEAEAPAGARDNGLLGGETDDTVRESEVEGMVPKGGDAV